MYSGVLIKTEVARIFIRVTDCDYKPLVHFHWKGGGGANVQALKCRDKGVGFFSFKKMKLSFKFLHSFGW